MIFANLATYPPRQKNLPRILSTISTQVDRLTIVLNQFDGVPKDLKIPKNTEVIIPEKDYKDVGKFLPKVTGAEYVFLLDDDIVYPKNYVAKSLELISASTSYNSVWGYHASWYEKPKFEISVAYLRSLWRLSQNIDYINSCRKVHFFGHTLKEFAAVDQLGTGTVILRPEHMPPIEYMEGSQRFVDVRFAKWCFENKIKQIALPREEAWLGELDHEEAIYKDFTSRSPDYVSKEIRTFAFHWEKLKSKDNTTLK